jgi:hypothetical protein
MAHHAHSLVQPLTWFWANHGSVEMVDKGALPTRAVTQSLSFNGTNVDRRRVSALGRYCSGGKFTAVMTAKSITTIVGKFWASYPTQAA